MLGRKMLRDMLGNRAQFISIFLMALLGVAVYTGINAEWAGMQAETDRYYAETRLADIWAAGEGFTADDIKKAEGVEGVAEVQGRLVLDVTAAIDGEPVLRLNAVDGSGVSLPKTTQGVDFDANADGVWLDDDFARTNGLAVGDTLRVEAMGIQIEKRILGLVIHPEYVYAVKDESELLPNHRTFGFAWLPRACLPGVDALPANGLAIRLDAGADTLRARAALETALAGRHAVILTRETHPSVAMFQNEIDQNRLVGGIFPVVFFLIAALMMLTTMTRLTAGQRIPIGTLRALGFSRQRILAHYVNYGLWLGLLGGLAGLAIGPALLPQAMFAMQQTTYTLPGWHGMIRWQDSASVAVAALFCGASAYLACLRELRGAPAAVLRPRAPRSGRHIAWEGSRFWRKIGFSAQWNVRDILRSPVRSAMAVAGVAGAMMLLLCALGLQDTIGGVSARMYGGANAYHSKIVLSGDADADVRDGLVRDFAGQPVQETAVEFSAGAAHKSGSLTVLGEGPLMRLKSPAGNDIALPPEGAAISRKMAALLGVGPGDTVRWRELGADRWMSAEIKAIYRSPMSQGIAMSREAYDAAGGSTAPTAVLAGRDAAGARDRPGVLAVQQVGDLVRSFDTMLQRMASLVAFMVAGAVILGVVVLYNLGTMSFSERARELATLKVLGFYPRQIRNLLLMQNVWLTALGIVAGIPAGMGLVGSVLSGMPDSLDLETIVKPVSQVVCVLGTLLLSMFVNLLLSAKVKTIDMVSPFKAVE